jgi:hypothetical protein
LLDLELDKVVTGGIGPYLLNSAGCGVRVVGLDFEYKPALGEYA